ncbi:MAG: glycosyltransferase [Caldilineaceae bacterium]
MAAGWLPFFFQILYALCAIGLGFYGLHALWLTYRLPSAAHFFQPETALSKLPLPDNPPQVTIQLPVYNERHVVVRLLEACARFEYPSDRLQIQLLDDSTDQTTGILERQVEKWQARGVNVVLVHRGQRTGYKAGALKDALAGATGEFIAIFDADFVPPSDFLARSIPHFLGAGQEQIGFVQARWDHLNRDYSVLTRCQALALDGHFVVEQAARQAAGYPFGFNGSGGVWRRACIEDPAVGGWQADTLCEDLDLSYRAQLAGWQPLFLPGLAAPAEIPPQLLAFKRQQFRWAKGSVQTLMKLGGPVWRSGWTLPARLAGLFHLGNYLIHPLLLLLLLISPLLLLLGVDPFGPLAWLSLASIGPPLLYAVAQSRLSPRLWLRRFAYLPVLTLLGMGLCLNNTLAVWQALTNRAGPFLRTPKFHVQARADSWQQSSYALPLDPVVLGEAVLALYGLGGVLLALAHGKWWSAVFLFLYAAGFGLMVGMGVSQSAHSGGKHPRHSARFRAIDLVKNQGR